MKKAILILIALNTVLTTCTCTDNDLHSFPQDSNDTTEKQKEECSDSVEWCDDNVDNDCDGKINENCLCTLGKKRKVWPAKAGDITSVLKNPRLLEGSLSGICKRGTQTCAQIAYGGGGSRWGIWDDGNDGIGGTDDDKFLVGEQFGAVLPQTEICDSIDNDCDGRIDEGLKKSCWSRDPEYYTFNSPENKDTPCRLGVRECVNGTWSNCEHEILPTREICDGIDNNCNGHVDDNVLTEGDNCGLADVGTCTYGSLVCDFDTRDMLCDGYTNPTTEVCDGRDNDCDGDIDEDTYKPCETLCGSGFETCIFGHWQNCSAQKPTDEICDGRDNDCDGLIDEELVCTCPPEAIGALVQCIGGNVTCGMGYRTCISDIENDELIMTECCQLQSFVPMPESIDEFQCLVGEGQIFPEECNNYDDDCDGIVDEDLTAECYTGPADTNGVGECQSGIITCLQGRWGNFQDNTFINDLCINEVLPIDEFCNNNDDDCDGIVDEDLSPHEKVDIVFVLDKSGSMCNKVRALKDGIQPYVADFMDTEHHFAIVSTPGTLLAATVDERAYNIVIDLSSADALIRALSNWECAQVGVEPQYDALYSIARGDSELSFRDDAFPIVVIMTDETAQSIRRPPLTPESINIELSPCQIGDCDVNNKLEVYIIVQEGFFSEWCAPANIAQKCYDLFPGIDGATITEYLRDIFIDVCR